MSADVKEASAANTNEDPPGKSEHDCSETDGEGVVQPAQPLNSPPASPITPKAEPEEVEEEEEEEDEDDELEVDATAEFSESESGIAIALEVDRQRSVIEPDSNNSLIVDGSSSPLETLPQQVQQTAHDDASVYHVKWVTFHNQQVPILTQNENGPCPLIAIANVLLLRQVIKLPPNAELVTSQQIVEYFANYLLSADIKNLTNEERASFQQNMDDAFTLFPKLQTGLDMNLRFSGARDFEYTPELGIFDLFEIPIYHGWLVDPQETELAELVRNCSYNQLVEKIINDKMNEANEVVRRALLAEQFLEQTASQLTYYGLCELNSAIKEDQLAVFFRNNHFNTLYMHKNSLYLLVTDQGFLQESHVVWETLNDVEGNSHFTDSHFRVYQKPEVSPELPQVSPTFVNTPEQVDSDYQLALSLANDNEEDNQAAQPASLGRALTLEESDYALARRLQEEEDKIAAQMEGGGSGSGQGIETAPAPHAAPAAAEVPRAVPRSASQPGPAPHRPRATVQQARRRESGESCVIL